MARESASLCHSLSSGHQVITENGEIGGYGGVVGKKWLLEHERRGDAPALIVLNVQEVPLRRDQCSAGHAVMRTQALQSLSGAMAGRYVIDIICYTVTQGFNPHAVGPTVTPEGGEHLW